MRRRIITPAETMVNATSVPMLVISARNSIGSSPASREMTTAAISVAGTGVSVRGLIRWNSGGIIPSRPIANRIRVWP